MLLPPGEPFRELVGGSASHDENLLKQQRIVNICSPIRVIWRKSAACHHFSGQLEPASLKSCNPGDMRSNEQSGTSYR
jgi:hypothetical protein